jgi:carbamoyl-phosphate synthase small subunit
VSCTEPYEWQEGAWSLGRGFGRTGRREFHVVAVDYGVKRNILRCLSARGCRVTVVPAHSSATTILAYEPDGVFLSNGPGDPQATSVFAVPVIRDLLAAEVPLFGICLGHQVLALALGAKTKKMHRGHRGANHPVKNLATGAVEITSQNHGFVVERDSLPAPVTETHVSLFDDTVEGIRLRGRPVFSVQYHPEASPGPMDSQDLFRQFVDWLREHRSHSPIKETE